MQDVYGDTVQILIMFSSFVCSFVVFVPNTVPSFDLRSKIKGLTR